MTKGGSAVKVSVCERSLPSSPVLSLVFLSCDSEWMNSPLIRKDSARLMLYCHWFLRRSRRLSRRDTNHVFTRCGKRLMAVVKCCEVSFLVETGCSPWEHGRKGQESDAETLKIFYRCVVLFRAYCALSPDYKICCVSVFVRMIRSQRRFYCSPEKSNQTPALRFTSATVIPSQWEKYYSVAICHLATRCCLILYCATLKWIIQLKNYYCGNAPPKGFLYLHFSK